MTKITIRIWNFGLNNRAQIEVYDCSLGNIWWCIHKLKIDKNKIECFEQGNSKYIITYAIKNYKEFVKSLIEKLEKIKNNMICVISLIDMETGQEYIIKSDIYWSKIIFPPPLIRIKDEFLKKRRKNNGKMGRI